MNLSSIIMIILEVTSPILFITFILVMLGSATTSSTRPLSSTFAQTLKLVIKVAIFIAIMSILSIVIIFSKIDFMKTKIDCKPMTFVSVKSLQDYMTFEETVVTTDKFQEIPIGDFTVTTTDATEGDFIVASSEKGLIACMMSTESHNKLQNRSKTYTEIYKDANGDFHYIPSTKEVYNLYKEGKYSGAKNYMQQIRTTYLLNDKINQKIAPYFYKDLCTNEENLKSPFIIR